MSQRGARVIASVVWGSGLSLLVAAAAVPGLLALLLLPLAGFGYFVFCLIAVRGSG